MVGSPTPTALPNHIVTPAALELSLTALPGIAAARWSTSHVVVALLLLSCPAAHLDLEHWLLLRMFVVFCYASAANWKPFRLLLDGRQLHLLLVLWYAAVQHKPPAGRL